MNPDFLFRAQTYMNLRIKHQHHPMAGLSAMRDAPVRLTNMTTLTL